MHTFLEMNNIIDICAANHAQQYVRATISLCAVNLSVCAVSEGCVRAHSFEATLPIHQNWEKSHVESHKAYLWVHVSSYCTKMFYH